MNDDDLINELKRKFEEEPDIIVHIINKDEGMILYTETTIHGKICDGMIIHPKPEEESDEIETTNLTKNEKHFLWRLLFNHIQSDAKRNTEFLNKKAYNRETISLQKLLDKLSLERWNK